VRFESKGWRCPRCGWEPPSDPYPRFAADEEANIADESFELLAEFEPRSFWFRSRNDLIVWALRAYFPHATSLFEVGCGTGFVLMALQARCKGLRLAGGELSPAGIQIARSRLPEVPIVQLDARRLPFEREYDIVAAFDVLEHIDDDEAVLSEMARAATAQGGLLIAVPQHPWLWGVVDDFSGHVRRYTRDELVRKIERAGLRVVRVTSFVSLLVPLVAASRLLRGGTPEAYDPRKEFALPRVADRLFEWVMRLERSLIERGVSFPAGSSLLAIAVRN
jgi:SAM-dependent methyltransferase